MSTVSQLLVQVRQEGAEKTAKAISNVENAGTKFGTNFVKSAAKIAAAWFSIRTAISLTKQLVEVQREFDKVNATLITITGSAEQAAVAFAAIEKVAYQMPFELNDVVDAFISLRNRGLDPSAKALQDYGNIAAATGKPLAQIIRATGQATVGNIMSLRQLDIVATRTSDGIRVSYQGITEEIEDSAAAIENYVRKIGSDRYAGAVTNRLGRLDDTITAISETWKNLLREIARGGVGEVINDALKTAIDSVKFFDLYLKENATVLPQFFKTLQVAIFGSTLALEEQGNEYDVYIERSKNVGTVITSVAEVFGFLANSIRTSYLGMQSFSLLYKGLRDVVLQKRFDMAQAQADRWNQAATAEMAKRGVNDFNLLPDDFKRQFENEMKEWRAAEKALRESREGILNQGLDLSEFKANDDVRRKAVEDSIANLAKAIKASTAKARKELESTGGLTIIDSLNGVTSAEEADPTNILGRTRVEGNNALSSQREKEFEALRQSYMTERELILEENEKTRELINANGLLTIQEREMLFAIQASRTSEQLELVGMTERDMLQEQWELTRETLEMQLEDRLISEADFQAKSAQAWTDYMGKVSKSLGVNRDVKAFELEMQSMSWDIAANLVAVGQEVSKSSVAAQKAFFVASKAIAIAQAIVNTNLAATNALAQGDTYTAASRAAMIKSLGYSSVALIAAQSVSEFAGNFDSGGVIHRGQWGIAGEYGPEIVQGPAAITSRKDTADLLGTSQPAVNIIVNNNAPNTDVRAEYDPATGDIRLFVEKIEQQIASNVASGRGPLSTSAEKAWNLKRGYGQR